MVDLSKISKTVQQTVADIKKMNGDENKIDSKKEYDELGKLLSGKDKLKGKEEVEYIQGLLNDYADKFMVSDDTKSRVLEIVKNGQKNKADDANEVAQLKKLLKTKGLSTADKAFIIRMIKGHEVKMDDEVQPEKPPVEEPPKENPPVKEPTKEDTKEDTKMPKEKTPKEKTLPPKTPLTKKPKDKKPVKINIPTPNNMEKKTKMQFPNLIFSGTGEPDTSPCRKPIMQKDGSFRIQILTDEKQIQSYKFSVYAKQINASKIIPEIVKKEMIEELSLCKTEAEMKNVMKSYGINVATPV